MGKILKFPKKKEKESSRYHECKNFIDEMKKRPEIYNKLLLLPPDSPLNVRIGFKSGVNLYFLSIPSKDFHGLYLKIKACGDTRPLAISEREWLINAQEEGYAVVVALGHIDACDVIDNYLE